MPKLVTLESDIDQAAVPEQVKAIVASTRVANVRLDEVHAGPLNLNGEAPVYWLRSMPSKFAYLEAEDQMLVRVEHEVKISADETLDDATDVSIAHVISFEIEQDIEVSNASLSAWIEGNVYFMVYPYVRESLASLTTRMGLPPLTIDYLPRDSRGFERED